jgi:hypothetical protein
MCYVLSMADSQKEREKMLEIIGTVALIGIVISALVTTWNKAY